MTSKADREKKLGKTVCALLRSWFELTADEQKAVVIVLAIFILGVAFRFWHVCLRK
jgi:hypothetical protein